jgi:hypothetical protein
MPSKYLFVFGIILAVIGVLGFIGGFGIVGPEGFFMTDTFHDTIHLLSGIVFILVAKLAPKQSSMTMIIFGVVYLLVALFGFNQTHVMGMLVNNHDSWFHIAISVVLFICGIFI